MIGEMEAYRVGVVVKFFMHCCCELGVLVCVITFS